MGPVIGGAFADSAATWRWSFYINLVVYAIFVPVYLFMIPVVNPQPNRTTMEKVKTIDYVGIFLVLAGMCFLITPLSMGGSLFEWDSATTITLLVLGVILMVAFILQQAFCIFTTREHRIFPIHYFKSRTMGLMFFMSFCGGPPIMIPVYFLSLFFQFGKGDTAMEAAIKLLPFIFMSVFFVLLNGGVMGKEGHYAPWYLVASPIIIAAAALMYTVDENTSTAAVYGYSALMGIGAGCLIQVCFVVAQAVVPRVEMPMSVAFISFAQTTGIALTLTITNTIFLNLAQRYISSAIPTATPGEVKAAMSGVGGPFLASLTLEQQGAVVHAIVKAISKCYLVLLALASCEFIASWFLKWERVFLEM